MWGISGLCIYNKMQSEEDSSVTESIGRYVLDPDAKVLDLQDVTLNTKRIKSILEFLDGSDIYEFNLTGHKLTKKMVSFSKCFVTTKLTNLNLSRCELSSRDVLSLMSVLKDSLITDLNISWNMFELSKAECREFLSYLAESHLTSLNLGDSARFKDVEDVLDLIRVLCGSSITHLNLEYLNREGKFSEAIMSLFHHLEDSAITHLNLAGNWIHLCKSFTLGDDLRKSKLIELDLSKHLLRDHHIKELSKALIGTQITSLNLSKCVFDSFTDLFLCLKKTQIRRLDLTSCVSYVDITFDVPKFLSGASMVSMNFQHILATIYGEGRSAQHLRSSKLKKLDVVVNYLKNVTEVSFYINNFASVFRPLSKDKRILLINFVESLKNSSVKYLKMTKLGLCAETGRILFPCFENSKHTHLDLGRNYLGGSLQSLAGILKSTALTDLNLESNRINDNDAEVLAACLKETRLVTLNLENNYITDHGAQFLALSLEGSDILSLNLRANRIKNRGMKVLAKYAATSLITTLKVSINHGNTGIVETVIWNNRRSVLEIVRFFKEIAPESGKNSYRFEDNVDTKEVDTFLEECLSFYYLAMKYPSLSLVLSRDENISQGRDQIRALLSEEFPRQFVQFIATAIEAEISDHINFLKKVEEMGLTQIVELLLLNRPLYFIDQSQGILHPYFYQMLNKYKLPICNLDIEPHGIERILEYFNEFSDIEGATEVIRLLRNVTKQLT